MVERLFKLSENKTGVRTEALAGMTTFPSHTARRLQHL
jgi:xanthine/uracil/vitamin C permease (AzgA family)